MFISTLEAVPGPCQILGVVQGVASCHCSDSIVDAFRDDHTNHSDGIRQAVQIAMQYLSQEAEKLGADAVVGVRFSMNSATSDLVEVLAYGTAVKLQSPAP